MGAVLPLETACLVLGMFSKSKDAIIHFLERASEFDHPAMASDLLNFEFTEYYRSSMGFPLYRRFLFYPPGFSQDQLPGIKIRTNELEEEATRVLDLGVERPINLDPGYLTLSKLVLASTKDHSHRIYLGRGIFGEVTLFFRKGTFQAWPWTYPDYASKGYIDLFNRARENLLGSQKGHSPRNRS